MPHCDLTMIHSIEGNHGSFQNFENGQYFQLRKFSNFISFAIVASYLSHRISASDVGKPLEISHGFHHVAGLGSSVAPVSPLKLQTSDRSRMIQVEKEFRGDITGQELLSS